MSNSRNLADLLGTNSTIQTAKIADDAITNAKLNDSGSFTIAGLTVSGASTFQGAATATSTTEGFGAFDKILLNATDDSATDAGDSLLLNGTDSSSTDDGDEVLFEDATGDPNTLLNSNDTGFTGTITGISNFVLLLNSTISSAVTNFDIDSTHINSDFNTYYCTYDLNASIDDGDLLFRVFVGGAVQTGNIYALQAINLVDKGVVTSYGTNVWRANRYAIGNASGEGTSGYFWLHNVNSTTTPAKIHGATNSSTTSAQFSEEIFGGSLIPANRANVVNGLRFFFEGSALGDITSGTVKLYGVKE